MIYDGNGKRMRFLVCDMIYDGNGEKMNHPPSVLWDCRAIA
jgi:hypothetical protein